MRAVLVTGRWARCSGDWLLESSQFCLWTGTGLWQWSVVPNMGFSPWVHWCWLFWRFSIIFYPLLFNRERYLSYVFCGLVHDIYPWRFTDECHLICLTGLIKNSHARLCCCLSLLWLVAGQSFSWMLKLLVFYSTAGQPAALMILMPPIARPFLGGFGKLNYFKHWYLSSYWLASPSWLLNICFLRFDNIIFKRNSMN